MLAAASVKSEIKAAGGAVPVHFEATGGLQSTTVDPPVPVVAAPPVVVPLVPPVSVPVAAPPVVTVTAPPVALTEPPVEVATAPPVLVAPPPTDAFEPPVELVVPPTAAPVPPPLLVEPPDVLLVLPPTLLDGLLFVVDELQPITNEAITRDSNPMPEINEARRVVMTKTPFPQNIQHPTSLRKAFHIRNNPELKGSRGIFVAIAF